MKKLLLCTLIMILAHGSFADQLDGLAIFDFLIYFLLIGAISLLLMVFFAVIRFTRKNYKVSIPLNFSASVFILCALIALGDLDSRIDPGFLAFCLGGILLAIILIILNYRIGKHNSPS